MARLSRDSCCLHPNGLDPPVVTGRMLAACRTLFSVPAENVAALAGLTPYSLSRLERCHRLPAPGEVRRLMNAIGTLADKS